MSTTIEQLELQIQSSATSAVSGIDALSASLSTLKNATKGGVGLTSVANQVRNLDTALKSVDGTSAAKIDRLATSLEKLKNLGQIKLSSSIGNQLKNIGSAASSLTGVDMSGIERLGRAIAPLNGLGKATGLQSIFGQLKKLPEIARELNGVDWTSLTTQLTQLTNTLAPLATQLNAVSSAFNGLPSNIRRIVTATNSMGSSNDRAAKSYTNLLAKITVMVGTLKAAGMVVAGWINQSNSYIENLNLFTASMGEYADEAKRYAEQVGEIMGIDPGEFMRNQGIFMTITEGFGVASDRAYIMSKNLTQLGYDLSSFFNISFADAMQKLESGISGELEPLRRLGYDLSEARLKAEALALGIDKSFDSMTQAEKAQLRYYAIMTQVTVAQGDMARTLNAPANQLRILQSQVTQCARALGNIFIPALNAVLPYAIAVAKVIRLLASTIASFFGFTLPEVDYSGISAGAGAIGDLADGAGDASSGLGSAAKKAKELKNALLGIDELNVISPNDSSAGAGGGGGVGVGGGDLGFELPQYDFLGNAVSSKIDEIVQKMKDWLGLTEDVDTWSELLHTRLGRILTTVGSIGLGIAAWKIGTAVIDGIKALQELKKNGLDNALVITVGLSLLVTGVSLEWSGIVDAIKNQLTEDNFAQIVLGGLITVGGGGFLGKGIATWITTAFADSAVATALTTAATNLGVGTAGAAGAALGAAVMGVVAGVPAFFTGIYDACKNGLNWLNGLLIPAGSTAASAGIGAIIGACGGPIGAGIGALIGLAVGLVTDGVIAIAQNWEAISTTFKKFFTVTLPGFFKNLPGTISEKWNAALAPIKNFDWKKFGNDCGKKVGTAVKRIGDSFKKFFTQTLPDVWTSVKESFATFFTQTLPTFFTEKIPAFFTTVKEGFITFFSVDLPEALGKAGDWFVSVGTNIWEGIKEGWNAAVKAVKDFVTGFVDGFKEALGIHSPSTVMRDEVGKFVGEGLLEGILLPLKKIGQWVMDNIITPIQKVVTSNPIKQGIELIKSGWSTVANWIGSIPVISQAIKLIKSGWETVKNWIGNIPTLSQAINLIKSGWSTIANWVGNIPTLSQAINLIKSGWSTVAKWVGNIPVLSQAINLIKSGWSTVANWIGSIPALSQAIKLSKSGWSTISAFIGTASSVGISLWKNGWSSIAGFVGNSVSVGISLFKSGWSSIKSFFGLSSGGYNTGHGWKMFEKGGYINGNGRSGFWDSIPMYANGTTNAGMHGSLFVAGENGTEMVGHLNGRTEVLNRSQISMAMRGAVIAGMSQFTDYWRIMSSQMTVCANGIIRSILVSSDVMRAAVVNEGSYYDPGKHLSQSVYEDSVRAYSSSHNEDNMVRSMSEFYREYVEPTLREIANDTKRQADKDAQTIVQIGNRTINDAVVTQQKANGFVFAK